MTQIKTVFFFQSETPESSELTSIAQYVLTSIVFVFCAMIEFAVALSIQRRLAHKRRSDKEEKDKTKREVWSDSNEHSGNSRNEIHEEDVDFWASEALCYKIDRTSLVLFPLSFAVYFTVYVISVCSD